MYNFNAICCGLHRYCKCTSCCCGRHRSCPYLPYMAYDGGMCRCRANVNPECCKIQQISCSANLNQLTSNTLSTENSIEKDVSATCGLELSAGPTECPAQVMPLEGSTKSLTKSSGSLATKAHRDDSALASPMGSVNKLSSPKGSCSLQTKNQGSSKRCLGSNIMSQTDGNRKCGSANKLASLRGSSALQGCSRRNSGSTLYSLDLVNQQMKNQTYCKRNYGSANKLVPPKGSSALQEKNRQISGSALHSIDAVNEQMGNQTDSKRKYGSANNSKLSSPKGSSPVSSKMHEHVLSKSPQKKINGSPRENSGSNLSSLDIVNQQIENQALSKRKCECSKNPKFSSPKLSSLTRQSSRKISGSVRNSFDIIDQLLDTKLTSRKGSPTGSSYKSPRMENQESFEPKSSFNRHSDYFRCGLRTKSDIANGSYLNSPRGGSPLQRVGCYCPLDSYPCPVQSRFLNNLIKPGAKKLQPANTGNVLEKIKPKKKCKKMAKRKIVPIIEPKEEERNELWFDCNIPLRISIPNSICLTGFWDLLPSTLGNRISFNNSNLSPLTDADNKALVKPGPDKIPDSIKKPPFNMSITVRPMCRCPTERTMPNEESPPSAAQLPSSDESVQPKKKVFKKTRTVKKTSAPPHYKVCSCCMRAILAKELNENGSLSFNNSNQVMRSPRSSYRPPRPSMVSVPSSRKPISTTFGDWSPPNNVSYPPIDKKLVHDSVQSVDNSSGEVSIESLKLVSRPRTEPSEESGQPNIIYAPQPEVQATNQSTYENPIPSDVGEIKSLARLNEFSTMSSLNCESNVDSAFENPKNESQYSTATTISMEGSKNAPSSLCCECESSSVTYSELSKVKMEAPRIVEAPETITKRFNYIQAYNPIDLKEDPISMPRQPEGLTETEESEVQSVERDGLQELLSSIQGPVLDDFQELHNIKKDTFVTFVNCDCCSCESCISSPQSILQRIIQSNCDQSSCASTVNTFDIDSSQLLFNTQDEKLLHCLETCPGRQPDMESCAYFPKTPQQMCFSCNDKLQSKDLKLCLLTQVNNDSIPTVQEFSVTAFQRLPNNFCLEGGSDRNNFDPQNGCGLHIVTEDNSEEVLNDLKEFCTQTNCEGRTNMPVVLVPNRLESEEIIACCQPNEWREVSWQPPIIADTFKPSEPWQNHYKSNVPVYIDTKSTNRKTHDKSKRSASQHRSFGNRSRSATVKRYPRSNRSKAYLKAVSKATRRDSTNANSSGVKTREMDLGPSEVINKGISKVFISCKRLCRTLNPFIKDRTLTERYKVLNIDVHTTAREPCRSHGNRTESKTQNNVYCPTEKANALPISQRGFLNRSESSDICHCCGYEKDPCRVQDNRTQCNLYAGSPICKGKLKLDSKTCANSNRIVAMKSVGTKDDPTRTKPSDKLDRFSKARTKEKLNGPSTTKPKNDVHGSTKTRPNNELHRSTKTSNIPKRFEPPKNEGKDINVLVQPRRLRSSSVYVSKVEMPSVGNLAKPRHRAVFSENKSKILDHKSEMSIAVEQQGPKISESENSNQSKEYYSNVSVLQEHKILMDRQQDQKNNQRSIAFESVSNIVHNNNYSDELDQQEHEILRDRQQEQQDNNNNYSDPQEQHKLKGQSQKDNYSQEYQFLRNAKHEFKQQDEPMIFESEHKIKYKKICYNSYSKLPTQREDQISRDRRLLYVRCLRQAQMEASQIVEKRIIFNDGTDYAQLLLDLQQRQQQQQQQQQQQAQQQQRQQAHQQHQQQQAHQQQQQQQQQQAHQQQQQQQAHQQQQQAQMQAHQQYLRTDNGREMYYTANSAMQQVNIPINATEMHSATPATMMPTTAMEYSPQNNSRCGCCCCHGQYANTFTSTTDSFYQRTLAKYDIQRLASSYLNAKRPCCGPCSGQERSQQQQFYDGYHPKD